MTTWLLEIIATPWVEWNYLLTLILRDNSLRFHVTLV